MKVVKNGEQPQDEWLSYAEAARLPSGTLLEDADGDYAFVGPRDEDGDSIHSFYGSGGFTLSKEAGARFKKLPLGFRITLEQV